jgi:predicted Zn finger-like uncharacterized protein
MILSCNSCEKKFVVPDQAISAAGRTVQCGSCGNKWKQYPIKTEETKIVYDNKIKKKPNLIKTSKNKKKKIKKTREIDLYSPEYLEKKHGISLHNLENNKNSKLINKVSFGFYNSLILYTVIIIALSKSLHFFQDFIILKLPLTEFYITYYFESIKNIFEIWKNLISNY